jgi:CBS domain-containing protein
MHVAKVLDRKGAQVATIRPTATVAEAIAELARLSIGALVVTKDDVVPAGIITERDVVRSLNIAGASILKRPVADLMTADVAVCTPSDVVDDIMSRMTDLRIRHLPVMQDGALCGIVSIGDVVKARIDELEDDHRHLVDYISAR